MGNLNESSGPGETCGKPENKHILLCKGAPGAQLQQLPRENGGPALPDLLIFLEKLKIQIFLWISLLNLLNNTGCSIQPILEPFVLCIINL